MISFLLSAQSAVFVHIVSFDLPVLLLLWGLFQLAASSSSDFLDSCRGVHQVSFPSGKPEALR